MKQIIKIFFVLFILGANAQYSDRYIRLTDTLNKIETEIDTIFYSNKNPKFIIQRTKHEYNNEIVKTKFGTAVVYYRNGQIARKTQIDEFGNYISEKLFDRKGNLTEEWISTKIDNRAKNIEQFINEESYGDFKKEISYYKYSKKIKGWYKFKKGTLILNDSKFYETVKFLNEYGEIIKTKEYSFNE